MIDETISNELIESNVEKSCFEGVKLLSITSFRGFHALETFSKRTQGILVLNYGHKLFIWEAGDLLKNHAQKFEKKIQSGIEIFFCELLIKINYQINWSCQYFKIVAL